MGSGGDDTVGARPEPGDERVALYDPDDPCGREVGSSDRRTMRSGNLPHASAMVLVHRSGGEVFVHRRSEAKDLWPGRLDALSGGVVLAGEAPAAAAVRELAEELGITGTDLRPLLRMWFRDEHTWCLLHVFETLWDGPVSFDDGEISEGWWESPEALATRVDDVTGLLVPDTRLVLRQLLDALGTTDT